MLTMELSRGLLAVGLLAHKVIWELLRHKHKVSKTSQQTSSSRMAMAIKIAKAGVLTFLLIQTLFLNLFSITSDPFLIQSIGFILFGVGLTIAILGRLGLGDNWVDLEDYQVLHNQNLVTGGVYRYIRHPIYAGDLLLLTGLQLALNSWLVLAVIIPGVIVLRHVRAEEEILSKAFPQYQNYATKTKRLIPFIY